MLRIPFCETVGNKLFISMFVCLIDIYKVLGYQNVLHYTMTKKRVIISVIT